MIERPVKAGEVFTTFIFDGKDCADMGVYSVTSSGTYTYKIVPTFKDEVLEVPSYDGQYYYNTQVSSQDFVFNMFADNLSLKEYQALKTWLFPRKIGKLIMPDQPYKYYIVKVKSVGDLGEYPLTDVQTPTNSALGDYNSGNVVYTGRFTVTFQTVGPVYAYGLCYYRDDLIYDAMDWYGKDVYPDNYYYDSGLLYKDMAPALTREIPANAQNVRVTWYNPGTAKTHPILTLKMADGTIGGANSYIQIDNETTNASTVINLKDLSGTLIINTDEETIQDENGRYYFGRFVGNPVEISPEKDIIYIPETLVETVDIVEVQNYDNIYVINSGSDNSRTCVAEINPLAQIVDPEWVDNYYFCINDNGGALITNVNVNENTVILDTSVNTYDILPAQIDGEGHVTRGAGMECRYVGSVEREDLLPNLGSSVPGGLKPGDVALVNFYERDFKIKDNYGNDIEYPTQTNVMFMYRNNVWEPTNLFTNEREFYNSANEKEPRYLVFGANIIKMDKITISTNIGACVLSAAILARYV